MWEMYVDMQSHKEKLLEYLEKEYDLLGSQIESITNRAGIAVTLLSGVAFLALENVATGCRTISFLGYVFRAYLKTICSYSSCTKGQETIQ